MGGGNTIGIPMGRARRGIAGAGTGGCFGGCAGGAGALIAASAEDADMVGDGGDPTASAVPERLFLDSFFTGLVGFERLLPLSDFEDKTDIRESIVDKTKVSRKTFLSTQHRRSFCISPCKAHNELHPRDISVPGIPSNNVHSELCRITTDVLELQYLIFDDNYDDNNNFSTLHATKGKNSPKCEFRMLQNSKYVDP